MNQRVKVIEKGTTFAGDPFHFAQCVAKESNIVARDYLLSKKQQMDIILSYLPNSVPEYNVLELNTNLEGLLATISTFSTNIMTMPALEKAINEWVLNVSDEKAMHKSFFALREHLITHKIQSGVHQGNMNRYIVCLRPDVLHLHRFNI